MVGMEGMVLVTKQRQEKEKDAKLPSETRSGDGIDLGGEHQ